MNLRLINSIAAHAILFSGLTSSMPLLAQDGAVSPQVIQSTWVGKTVIGTLAAGPLAGKPINFKLSPDGTATIDGAVVDTGVWRLSDQGYCATWKKIRAGQERCLTVVRKGSDQLVTNPDGSLNTTITEIR